MKKVLLFDVWAFTPFTEISLEIAEKHKEQGDTVQIVNVATQLPHWEYKPLLATKSHYKATHYREREKLKKLETFAKSRGINYSSELLIDPGQYKMAIPGNISDIDALKEFDWNGYDMGMGIASYMISRTKDIEPDFTRYSDVINGVYSSSVIALNSFKQWYDKFRPDIVYIYNARLPLNRPILRYCQQNGYPFEVVDRGGAQGKYTITPNYNHDREMKAAFIEEVWENSLLSNSEKEKIAKEYYWGRINGISTKHFVEKQTKDMLPPCWDKKKRNISFFTGSFTEFAAIDKENKADTIFDSQFDAVREIASYLKNTEYKFYVRVHPNTKMNYPREYQKWVELRSELSDLIVFIEGDDPVDSYALAKNSDKVIVYMSSVGIEAAFLEVPSIVIGNSYYHRLGSNYTPSSKEELFKLLTDNNLSPKSRDGAMKYGFFRSTGGHDFKHFVYTDKYLGLYRGIDFNSLKSYPIKTRLIAYYLFFLDQTRAKGLLSAIKTFFNKEKMAKFRKNPISEM